MRRRRMRGRSGAREGRRLPDHELCRGPGNLTVALGITLAQNRLPLTRAAAGDRRRRRRRRRGRPGARESASASAPSARGGAPCVGSRAVSGARPADPSLPRADATILLAMRARSALIDPRPAGVVESDAGRHLSAAARRRCTALRVFTEAHRRFAAHRGRSQGQLPARRGRARHRTRSDLRGRAAKG